MHNLLVQSANLVTEHGRVKQGPTATFIIMIRHSRREPNVICDKANEIGIARGLIYLQKIMYVTN